MRGFYIYKGGRVSVGARNLQNRMLERHATRLVSGPPQVMVRNPNRQILDIINWGAATTPPNNWWGFNRQVNILNKFESVNIAGNKKLTFRAFNNWNGQIENGNQWVNAVASTENRNTAMEWHGMGLSVVVRHALRGHSGEGIEIIDPGTELPQADLYTVYKKKKHEFRVHVFNGRVILIQQKKRLSDQTLIDRGTATQIEGANARVRNLASGWIYAVNDIALTAPQLNRLSVEAANAVAALGLDFGAVDIIYNQREDQFYTLEVNTAPGLEGETTLDAYADAIQGWIDRPQAGDAGLA